MHFKAPDIGLDLGTCNTVVYVKNEGIVISEPTLVISRRGDKKPIAVGEDAQRMYGRTSDAEIAIHPIRNGMIANYDATVLLLRAFISKAVGESNLVKPRLVMSIPSEIDEVNRKALTAAVRACGLKKVYLIEKPLAAAIGAGLSVFEPEGCMVVDVVGARPFGQASGALGKSSRISACLPSVLSALAVIAISVMPKRRV